jgi:hypothetical protein
MCVASKFRLPLEIVKFEVNLYNLYRCTLLKVTSQHARCPRCYHPLESSIYAFYQFSAANTIHAFNFLLPKFFCRYHATKFSSHYVPIKWTYFHEYNNVVFDRVLRLLLSNFHRHIILCRTYRSNARGFTVKCLAHQHLSLNQNTSRCQIS